MIKLDDKPDLPSYFVFIFFFLLMEIRIIWNWFTSFKVSNDIGREKIPGSEDATCVVISREVSEKEFP